jgi:hypothetical protein
MQDFIGNPIAAGSWVACGGKGNTSCEYGMILHRVDAVKDGKLKLTRIRVSYPDHKNAQARVGKVTAANPNKYVVVTPGPRVTYVFERVANGTATQEQHDLCGKWLHGQKQGIWK